MPTQGTLARVETLNTRLRERALQLVTLAEARGWRITITEGRRSRTRQAELHANDPTGAAPPGKSRHEDGEAFDVAFLAENGAWSYLDTHPWEELGKIGESLGLVWGGRWKNKDGPHFELPRRRIVRAA